MRGGRDRFLAVQGAAVELPPLSLSKGSTRCIAPVLSQISQVAQLPLVTIDVLCPASRGASAAPADRGFRPDACPRPRRARCEDQRLAARPVVPDQRVRALRIGLCQTANSSGVQSRIAGTARPASYGRPAAYRDRPSRPRAGPHRRHRCWRSRCRRRSSTADRGEQRRERRELPRRCRPCAKGGCPGRKRAYSGLTLGSSETFSSAFVAFLRNCSRPQIAQLAGQAALLLVGEHHVAHDQHTAIYQQCADFITQPAAQQLCPGDLQFRADQRLQGNGLQRHLRPPQHSRRADICRLARFICFVDGTKCRFLDEVKYILLPISFHMFQVLR